MTLRKRIDKAVSALSAPKGPRQRKRANTVHLAETRLYQFAVVLKEVKGPDTDERGTVQSTSAGKHDSKPYEDQLDVVRRLCQANLRLCVLEPDPAKPNTVAILVQATPAALSAEYDRLRVEHRIRTGTDVQAGADSMHIQAGAEIVLTNRVLERALSEFVKDPQREVRPPMPGWEPQSLSKRLVPGVKTFFPLHDETFSR